MGQRELGEDALLVDTRLAPPAAMHLGRYEVVLATAPDEEPAIDENLTAPAVEFLSAPSWVEEIPALPFREMTPAVPAAQEQPASPVHQEAPPAEPRKRRTALRRVIRMSAVSRVVGAFRALPWELTRLSSRLTTTVLAAGSDLVQSVFARLRPLPASASMEAEAFPATPTSELEGALSAGASVELGEEEPRVAEVFGLPVAQETTDIVMIADNNSLQATVPVEILSSELRQDGDARQITALRGRPRNCYLPSLTNPTPIRTSCARHIKQTNEWFYPRQDRRFSKTRKKQWHS